MYEELVERLQIAAQLVDKGLIITPSLCLEAADAIEELEKFYQIMADAYETEVTKERWIPVTERLPEEGKFVLVYGDLYPNKHDGSVIAVTKRIDWNYWQGFGRERNITHWMPLPEPPKEESYGV